jgi:hypothetical protein
MSGSNNANSNAKTNNQTNKAQSEIDKYLTALSNFYPSPETRKEYAKHTKIEKLIFFIRVAINFIPYLRKIDPYKQTGASNWSISAEVHDRLLLRHTILNKLERLESTYKAHNELVNTHQKLISKHDQKKSNTVEATGHIYLNKKDEKECEPDNPHLRAYRIAATDLFVEKAIAYLEIDCNRYTRRGIILFSIGIIFVFIGIVTSGINTFECGTDFTANIIGEKHCTDILNSSKALRDANVKYYWVELVSKFTRGFTFYGMIVLLSVGCWRLGKAMLDQAERLRERRHSLRQGRLFIHLNNGNVTIEQLEKAFDWNVSKGNAFANIETEASAPWGAVLKEAVKILPEIFRRAKDAPAK